MHMLRRSVAPALVGALCFVALASRLTALPQLPGFASPSAAARAPSDAVSPLSPRASVAEFLRLTRAGEYDAASRHLSLSAAQRQRGATLARRLRTVLDQRLAIDLRAISPLASGDTTDGDLGSDRLATITGAGGREDAVTLIQSRSPPRTPLDAPRWTFAPATVNAIDGWYENLGNPWLRDRLPPALMRVGPFNVYLWQYIGIAVAIPVLLLLTWMIGAVMRAIVSRITARTSATWDDTLVDHIRQPFRLWVGALLAGPLFSMLELNARLSGLIGAATRVLVLLALFWALLRAIRLAEMRINTVAWADGHTPQARTLVPLFGNFLRVTLGIVGVLVALAQFGYPVGTLLAGLGIGGIAVALAAQKTVEHLFGSISLAADRAFRVGDWVRAGATEGAVERIGLRSTSFRTNERTIVRVPNGRLADERIETFGERDRILLRNDLDLTLDTPPARVEAIRSELLALLRGHPLVWPDTIRVYVTAFTDSAIRLNVMAWFVTTSYDEFLLARHTLLLEFIRIIERAGSSLAFPSRTIYHVNSDGTGDLVGQGASPAMSQRETSASGSATARGGSNASRVATADGTVGAAPGDGAVTATPADPPDDGAMGAGHSS